MPHDRAPIKTIALVVSLLTGFGCASDGAEDTASPGSLAGSTDRPGSCTSSIDASGLVCSTCGRGKDRTRECLPAQCSVNDHCLRCVDPKDRVGVDCSIDYEKLPTGGFSTSPGDAFNFASCSFMWGVAIASGTTCHYPGADSCVVDEEQAVHSLSCTYSDGSGSSILSASSEPLPDPLIGRPDDLPAPGACITEIGADGLVSCTTCAHDDLSATRSCHYPGVIACRFTPEDSCLSCTLVDGSAARLCNSDRGPRPVPLPTP